MSTVNSKKLKLLRSLNSKTQKDVADELKRKLKVGSYPSSTYAAKEGKGDFNKEEIEILCKFLKVTPDQLLVDDILEEPEINLTDLAKQISVMAQVQRASLELLLDLQKSKPGGRSISSEILKKYRLEGIFL